MKRWHKKLLHRISDWFMDPLMKLYFAAAAILSILSIINPAFGASAAIVLLTGSIWNFLDATGGIIGAISALINLETQDNQHDPTATKKKITWGNLIVSVLMASITSAYLLYHSTSAAAPVWHHILCAAATLSFALAMFGCMTESYHSYQQKPNQSNWHKTLGQADITAWFCAGLGASILSASILAHSVNPYLASVLVGIAAGFYAVAGLIKFLQVLVKFFQTRQNQGQTRISDITQKKLDTSTNTPIQVNSLIPPQSIDHSTNEKREYPRVGKNEKDIKKTKPATLT